MVNCYATAGSVFSNPVITIYISTCRSKNRITITTAKINTMVKFSPSGTILARDNHMRRVKRIRHMKSRLVNLALVISKANSRT